MSEARIADPGGLWAVVPVKDFGEAKQRLAPTLSGAERSALYRAMLEDVLGALVLVQGLQGILVVTRDPAATALARAVGAEVLLEQKNRGHTEASSFGARHLAAEGAAGMLQIPGDLPLLTATDISALLDAHGRAPAITLAPSLDERGSNAVVCSPPDLLPLRFGDDSFVPHLARARRLGVEPHIVKRLGFALDVDTIDDLMALLSQPASTRAHAYLEQSGIAHRLMQGDDFQAASP